MHRRVTAVIAWDGLSWLRGSPKGEVGAQAMGALSIFALPTAVVSRRCPVGSVYREMTRAAVSDRIHSAARA
jgi:hypothetical protein